MGIFNDITIGNESLKEIRRRGTIVLTMPIDNGMINNLVKYLTYPIKVYLRQNNNQLIDEQAYLEEIKKIFNILKASKNGYIIKIDVKNRELFRGSRFLSNVPPNVMLSISASETVYNQKEYCNEERKIENMINLIRTTKLSPFEKYLAVYDIVKRFRAYNGTNNADLDTYVLKYLLDDNNTLIVCAGYARLLEELLTRVGVPCKKLNVQVGKPREEAIADDDIKYEPHARDIVMIDDDKYNIHGIYLADPTWDSNFDYNLYLNSLLTFDRKKEARRMELISDEQLLLDFHDTKEFMSNIRLFIERSVAANGGTKEGIEIYKRNAYKNLYLKIIELLCVFNKNKAMELSKKYDDLLNVDISKITSQDLEKPLSNLLVEYAKYVMPLVNKKINNRDIITALTNIQKILYHKDDEEIAKWIDKLTIENKSLSPVLFPYIYDGKNLQSRFKK